MISFLVFFRENEIGAYKSNCLPEGVDAQTQAGLLVHARSLTISMY